MTDTLMFNGDDVYASGVGGENIATRTIAQMMLWGPDYAATLAQDVQAQAVGNIANNNGIALG